MSNVNHKTPKQRMVERIEATKIIGRVNRCALGLEEMTALELSAAKICLSKVVPDLKQVDWDGRLKQTIERVERTIVDP
jgi:hypothetical protein